MKYIKKTKKLNIEKRKKIHHKKFKKEKQNYLVKDENNSKKIKIKTKVKKNHKIT